MFLYKFSTGNPEGFDSFYVLTHEKEFSQEEFEAMAEQWIAESYEANHKRAGFAHLDTEYVEKAIEASGFKHIDYKASYDFEPYWGQSRIKSQRLLNAINKTENYCKMCDAYEPHEDDKSPQEVQAMLESGEIERCKDTCFKSLANSDKCPISENYKRD